MLIPTANIVGEPLDLFAREIRVQAFQNAVFVAISNQVGREDPMEFVRQALLTAPSNQRRASAPGRGTARL